MKVITNKQPRALMYLSDFNDAEQAVIRRDYNWMDPDDLECNFGFFKYRGNVYHLQDFMRTSSEATGDLDEWDGYIGDSYFSGVVMKLCDNDCNHVIVGRYSC